MRFTRQKRSLGTGLSGRANDVRDRVSDVGGDLLEQLTTLRERLAVQAEGLREQLDERSESVRKELRRRTAGRNKQESSLVGSLRGVLPRRRQDWRSRLASQADELRGELRDRSRGARAELARRSPALRELLPVEQPKQNNTARIVGGVVGGVVGAAVGALAVASQFGKDVVPLDRSVDAEPQIWQWRGRRIVYYAAGPREAAPVVLVHSINAAASAHEMRAPFARLADSHRVYAVDLLGFGASERPDIDYSGDLYAEFLLDFLREVSASAHVVASSHSGAFAVLAANSEPGLFKSLLLINPTGVVTAAAQRGAGSTLIEGLLSLPVVGDGMFNLLVSRPSLRYFMRRVYSNPAYLDDRTIEQNYLTSHQPGARHAPAAFISGALNVRLHEPLQRLRPRTLVVWSGRNGIQNVRKEREGFQRANPELEMQTLDEAGALIQDERREEFETLLRDWISRDEVPDTRQTGQQEVGE